MSLQLQTDLDNSLKLIQSKDKANK